MGKLTQKDLKSLKEAGIVFTDEQMEKMKDTGVVSTGKRSFDKRAMLDSEGNYVFPSFYIKGLTKKNETPAIAALRAEIKQIIQDNTVEVTPEMKENE